MKTAMVLVSLSLMLSMGLGCGAEDPAPLSEEELGQVEQKAGGPCRAHDDCPLGERCDLTTPYPGSTSFWVCKGYAVFGPSQNPCLTDLQCHRVWAYGSHCYYSHPGAGYGECML